MVFLRRIDDLPPNSIASDQHQKNTLKENPKMVNKNYFHC